MEKTRPYIGIVGIKDMTEALQVITIIHRTLWRRPMFHIPQVGVQVTEKSLRGETNQNRRNPLINDIPKIFSYLKTALYGSVFNVVHFTSKNPETLVENVKNIMGLGQIYEHKLCQGLQLNGAFSQLNIQGHLAEIRNAFPDLKIILQLNHNVLDELSPKQVFHRISFLASSIDYLLIDPSGGRGLEMNVPEASALFQMLISELPHGIGFAGGLRGENVCRIVSELRATIKTNHFSIDAEGGLRDKVGEGYGNDDFNRFKAEEYFKNAVEALR